MVERVDADYYVTKKDIDSFLSESSRAIIDKRLLITSTDLIGSKAIRTCEQQEKAVIRYMLSDFEEAAVEYPAHISELASAKRKEKPKPRPHQQVAIAEVVEGFQTHDRGQLIMTCGTGKTFATLWIKEQLKADTALVLLPSLSLSPA
jgi:predicted helicase